MDATTEMRAGTGADDSTIGELREELEAATTAAFMHMRMIAATASVEARLSVASALSIATARSLSVAFLMVAWLCLMVLTVLSFMKAGVSPEITTLTVAVGNVAIAVGLQCWQKWLIANIGFPRTRKLLRQLPSSGRRKSR